MSANKPGVGNSQHRGNSRQSAASRPTRTQEELGNTSRTCGWSVQGTCNIDVVHDVGFDPVAAAFHLHGTHRVRLRVGDACLTFLGRCALGRLPVNQSYKLKLYGKRHKPLLEQHWVVGSEHNLVDGIHNDCGAANRALLMYHIPQPSKSKGCVCDGWIVHLRNELGHPVSVVRVVRIASTDILHLKFGPLSTRTESLTGYRLLQDCWLRIIAEQASTEDVRPEGHEGVRKRDSLSLCLIQSRELGENSSITSEQAELGRFAAAAGQAMAVTTAW